MREMAALCDDLEQQGRARLTALRAAFDRARPAMTKIAERAAA